MPALPLYTITSDGHLTFANGALLHIAPELSTSQHVNLYRLAPPGWHVCGLGYYYHAAIDKRGTKYVVAGLMIEGERTPKRKLYFPGAKYHKETIEQLMKDYIKERDAAYLEIEEARREKESELGILVHDLRALSSAIYNAGLEAKTELERANYPDCDTRIENILATQTLLSIRIDGLDLVANPLLAIPEWIPVFRRTDKVIRCFKALGNSKRVFIYLQGHSYGEIFGPNVFEVIPFTILDNAIKYSPAGQTVDIRFIETDREINIEFKSVGPKIDLDEIEKIFDKLYRGRHAAATGVAGTGIGLSIVRKLIVEHFAGSIEVSQPAERFQIGLVPYCDTVFTLRFSRRR